jgi:hypothetical protein
LRLFYVVTVAGDFIFAAENDQGAKAQSRYAVAAVREATRSDIDYVRRVMRGTIPTIPPTANA